MTTHSKLQENWLFFKRSLKNPLRVGAWAPVSENLATMVGKNVSLKDGEYVVEVGGGTGQLTRGLLRGGVPVERLFVIEIDPEMATYLKKIMPQVNVIQGDASKLKDLLPIHVIGKVSTIVSGIPLFNMSHEVQKALVDSCFGIMGEGGEFLQYAYAPVSPLPAEKFGLTKTRIAKVMFNLPPAAIWRYTSGGAQDLKSVA